MSRKDDAPWYTWTYPADFKTAHPDAHGASEDATVPEPDGPAGSPKHPASDTVREALSYSYKKAKKGGITYEDYERSRLVGVDFMSDKCAGASVLDLGCAEGLVSHRLVEYGASLVHGIDGVADRVVQAQRLYGEIFKTRSVTYRFVADNFGSWLHGTPPADYPGVASFFERNKSWLLPEYDIVLLLGVFHKMENRHLDAVLGPIAQRTRRYLLCRGGCTKPSDLKSWLQRHGFSAETRLDRNLRVFRRT